MITVCTKPLQPAANELVSDCAQLSGGVLDPSIAKKSLEVINPPSPYWQDEQSDVFVTEESGALIELA
jgi:hypothetical protein